MKQGKNFLRSITDTALEGEPLPGIPLVEIIGTDRVLVENHQGVVGFGGSEIRIKVRSGVISVCGDHLRMRKLSKEQLIITGKICTVALQGG